MHVDDSCSTMICDWGKTGSGDGKNVNATACHLPDRWDILA